MSVPERSPREMNVAFVRGLALDRRGIAARSDDHEVVVHHEEPAREVAGRHVLQLGSRRVHEHDVGVPAGADLERLAGTHRRGLHAVAVALLEVGDEGVEEPGVLCAGRRREEQRRALAAGVPAERGARAEGKDDREG